MPAASGVTIGKYRLFGKIGTGGMGTVHLGRFFGPGGFRRIVAIKRLHPQFAEDDEFVSAFLDEARLASRIHHPNVVASLDVVAEGGEVFLVFEHVPGVALSTLLAHARKLGGAVPVGVAVAVMLQVLHGLQAAHDAKGDLGEPLGLVHRDVSPQNVLVGRDGVARLLDFGVAKAAGRSQHTVEGVIKGKRGYMAPEHLLGAATQVSDVYSAAVVLWEMLAGQRLFPDDTSIAARLSRQPARPISSAVAGRSEALAAIDEIALRGLSPDVSTRFASASEMALALEALSAASAREVGKWVELLASAELAARDRLIEESEQATQTLPPPAAASEPIEASEVATFAASPAPARKRRWAPALGLAAIAILGLAIWRLAPSADAVAASGAEASASAAPVPVASSNLARVEAPPTSSSEETPFAETSASAGSRSSSAPPQVVKARPSQAKRPAPACKPYVTDADGHKKFNEACLR